MVGGVWSIFTTASRYLFQEYTHTHTHTRLFLSAFEFSPLFFILTLKDPLFFYRRILISFCRLLIEEYARHFLVEEGENQSQLYQLRWGRKKRKELGEVCFLIRRVDRCISHARKLTSFLSIDWNSGSFYFWGQRGAAARVSFLFQVSS